MSDTPRTDKEAVLCNYGVVRVTADLSRQLERELQAKEQELAEAKRQLAEQVGYWKGQWNMCAASLDIAKHQLAARDATIAGLRDALEKIIRAQPSTEGGGCFYPRHDGDGEYIGEENVDPLSVIYGMAQIASESLAQVPPPKATP
jgi:hypothetical protein